MLPATRRVFLCLTALAVALLLLVGLVPRVHPFLAVTQRVDADVLVVEGWIYDYMMPACAEEFRTGQYRLVLTSGLSEADSLRGGAARLGDAENTLRRLVAQGIPREVVVAAPAMPTNWARTAAMARAVRDKLKELGVEPRGVNVVTAGPHARQTWVAYDRIVGRSVPVGIVSIPKTSYPPDRWWTSGQGLTWVPKDLLGWMKEVAFGHRS